ncbi:MAG: ligase-associated DNA damage response endonuclease PdeM [Alphaproteobacteria bacterium]|nr:ligase-associated DNA damage response endonuclease PdeM [Alphaproteobacteria bacterium]
MSEILQQTSAEPTAVESIKLGDTQLVPDLSGALWLPDTRTVLVADLHFEKGSSFAAKGVHLPPYDTGSTLTMLEQVVARYAPDRMISLGDSFHDDTSRARMSQVDVERIRVLTGRTEFIWITGNHDTSPPEDLGGTIAGQLTIGELNLQHEPSGGLSFSPEVSGHLHPVAAVSRRGRRLRRRCFACDGARLVMPAFGAFTGGLNVMSEAFYPVFPNGKFWVWMLGREAVYKIHSRHLRA